MCMYVCMYVRMHVCRYARTYVCTMYTYGLTVFIGCRKHVSLGQSAENRQCLDATCEDLPSLHPQEDVCMYTWLPSRLSVQTCSFIADTSF